mmetsp:Transcript_12352/g.14542  ORF Transcript_12352/g.14542 Transcript_12352/m.14542 type:complete len:114 (-) Transcript_12352:67-408(-)
MKMMPKVIAMPKVMANARIFALCGAALTIAATATVTATASASMTAGQLKALNLLSGVMAGTVASCITNPLEVIRTQLQSSSACTGELAAAGGNPMAIGRRIFEAQGIRISRAT